MPYPLTSNFLKWRIVMLWFVFVIAASGVVHAEPHETIRSSGDSSNRIDIAIVGDGYTAAEAAKYRADVTQLVEQMFLQDPYREYQSYFNVHRVDVTSEQSGADHPERNPQVMVNTAFDATYNCSNIQRLICVNQSRVINTVGNSLAADAHDIIVVLINDSEYGGSGGSVAVASTHESAVELVLHELGHSFGLLTDEYGGTGGYGSNCAAPQEFSEPNATVTTAREQIKWRHWIDDDTPLPTTSFAPAVPGLYKGSRYCDAGFYRPTYNSKMRSLGAPFEQINLEQLIRRIYTFVAPLETVAPAQTNLTFNRAQSQTFNVTVLQPTTHALEISWQVDGVTRAIGTTFTLPTHSVSVGTHIVEVVVRDTTDAVRNDSQKLLEEKHSWNLNVTGRKRRFGFRSHVRN